MYTSNKQVQQIKYISIVPKGYSTHNILKSSLLKDLFKSFPKHNTAATGMVYLKFHLNAVCQLAGDPYTQSESLSPASAAQEVNSNDTNELSRAQYKELYFLVLFSFYR